MAVTWTARTIGLLAAIVRTVAAVIGGLILVHAVFVLFDATKTNMLVQFTAGIRDFFGGFTHNPELFHPSDKNTNEAINDALAGFIWVFLGSLAAKLIARLATSSKGKDKDKSSRKKDDTPRSTPVQKNQPEKPKDEPKQAAPKQEQQPKREEPKQEAPKQDEPDRAAATEKPGYDAPKDDAQKDDAPKERPEPESEDESSAKHQARDTARDDERADEPAGDKAQA